MLKPGSRYVLLIPAVYFLAAGAWILFSDMAVDALFHDPQAVSSMQTFKGWFFVVATSLLLKVCMLEMVWGSRKRASTAMSEKRIQAPAARK